MDDPKGQKVLLKIADGFTKTFECVSIAPWLEIHTREVDKLSYVSSNASEIAFRLFRTWIEQEGSEATPEKLHTALIEIERKDLAKIVKSSFMIGALPQPSSLPSPSETQKVDWSALLNTVSANFSLLGMCNSLQRQLLRGHEATLKRLQIEHGSDYPAIASSLFDTWLAQTPELTDEQHRTKLKSVFTDRMRCEDLTINMERLYESGDYLL